MGRVTVAPSRRLILFLPAAGLSLVAAAWAGLVRMGWAWPVPLPYWPVAHGPLMVSGFLGTVITLERAVAWGAPWAYGGPVAAATGALLLLVGQGGAAAALWLVAAGVLVGVYVAAYRKQPAEFTAVMGLGAVCWGVGTLLYGAGWPLARVVWWWVAFLVLTIVGERLELSRMRPPSPWRARFLRGLVGVYVAALAASLLAPGPAGRLAGVSLAGLAAWLARYDVARVTWRMPGWSSTV